CTGVKFSPDGKLLATVGGDENVQVWGISPIKKIFDRPTADGSGSVADASSLAFHPLKPLVAVGCVDLRFWDLRNGARMNLLSDAPAKGVRSVVFSPNG